MKSHQVIYAIMCLSLCTFTNNLHAAYAHPENAPTNRLADSAPDIELPNPNALIKAKVIRIFDADTVLLQIGTSKRRYQLLGANAPEYLPKAKRPAPFSIEARRFIEQLILGESVYIQHDPAGERDTFNRRAAYIFRAPDMLFVNLELVRQAYAKHDPRHMSLYASTFAHYQSKAQSLNRGLWNPNAPTLDWSDASTQPKEDPEPKADQPASENTTEKPAETTKPQPEQTPVQTTDSTIYITKSGKKYHSKDCPHLSNTNRPTTREKIKDSHQACKTCKPNK